MARLRTPNRGFAGRFTGLIAVAGICAAASAAQAQQDEAQQNQLEEVERALQKDRSRAEALQHRQEELSLEIQALNAESIATARKAQDLESKLSAIEDRLAALEREAAEKAAALGARRKQLGTTLAALQRIALQPADAMLASPRAPVDTVRSAMLLRVAVPAIERRAAALRSEIESLGALREEIALQQGKLAETGQASQAERARLSAVIQRKTAVRRATAAEQDAARQRAKRLASQAKDLRDLIERIERDAATRMKREAEERAKAEARVRAEAEAKAQARADAEAEAQARADAEAEEREAGEPETREQTAAAIPALPKAPRADLAKPAHIRPFPTSVGSLVMPARGRVITRYGQDLGSEGVSRGITIAVRKGAQVVAPYDGRVVYAGTFRRYGLILIIEHDGRYHTLLAGLDRIDTIVGQWLLAGEPVGVLGSPRNGNPELYLELRRTGQPINPLPWLATTDDKVRG